ncbi:hypothetical protein CSA17_05060 [bacterium DOLJORAL78_65_58]|nr:MAG: hypothetical protein CSB20_02505 [bacterium DOLZORAL124_64_63]PIE75905.1 MAG: hypothetical protein CSA17_05060 [bacterium DOLJORAL78_65_58]
MAGITRLTHLGSGPRMIPGDGMMADDGAMARRKGVVTGRLVIGLMVFLYLGLVMSSRVFLASQITDQRARIANLESRKEFLEASNADLHRRWFAASAPAVVMERARTELGLVATETPGPVLVLLPDHTAERSQLAALRAGVEQVFHGTMVSLQPRAAHADPVTTGGE